MRAFVILLAIIFIAIQGQAIECGKGFNNATPNDFGKSPQHEAVELLDKLIARGHNQVGEINLQKLRNDMLSVKWKWGPYFVISSNNRGIVNLPESREVCTNTDSWKNTPEPIWGSLALHENLGALGYTSDDNYQLSAALHSLSIGRMKAEDPIFSNLTQNFEQRKRKKAEISLDKNGGVTGVGGGGDPTGLQIKSDMYEALPLIVPAVNKIAGSQRVTLEEAMLVIGAAQLEYRSSWSSSEGRYPGNISFQFRPNNPPLILVQGLFMMMSWNRYTMLYLGVFQNRFRDLGDLESIPLLERIRVEATKIQKQLERKK